MNLMIFLMNAAQQTQKTGLWASFVRFLSSILESLNKVTSLIPEVFGVEIGGYGLAIVLFTLLMRLVLMPFDLKARRANQKIQEIQPQLAEIQKKYKNDPDKLNKKTMELYQKHKVNPMGRCLPMLLQMPLSFALFAELRTISDVEIAKGSIAPLLWIRNIWQPDSPLKSFTAENIAIFGQGFNGLFILPALAGITSYYQMRMSQPSGEQGNQMKGFATIMPLMSVWFCTMYTASFAIYWVTSNLYQIVQQFIINKSSTPKKEVGDSK